VRRARNKIKTQLLYRSAVPKMHYIKRERSFVKNEPVYATMKKQ